MKRRRRRKEEREGKMREEESGVWRKNPDNSSYGSLVHSTVGHNFKMCNSAVLLALRE